MAVNLQMQKWRSLRAGLLRAPLSLRSCGPSPTNLASRPLRAYRISRPETRTLGTFAAGRRSVQTKARAGNRGGACGGLRPGQTAYGRASALFHLHSSRFAVVITRNLAPPGAATVRAGPLDGCAPCFDFRFRDQAFVIMGGLHPPIPTVLRHADTLRAAPVPDGATPSGRGKIKAQGSEKLTGRSSNSVPTANFNRK